MMRAALACVLMLAAQLPSRSAVAEEAVPSPDELKKILKHRPSPTENVNADYVPEETQPAAEIWSHFSAGMLLNLWGTPPVDEAEIRDGRVRIVKTSQFSAGVGLQAYYPFRLWTKLRSPDLLPIKSLDKEWNRYSEWGIGPYVGVSLATDDIIDTIAVGLAVSVRRKEGGLRFGFGVAFDPDAQHLAADFAANRPAPADATEIRYIHEMAVGGQVMLSFTPGFSD